MTLLQSPTIASPFDASQTGVVTEESPQGLRGVRENSPEDLGYRRRMTSERAAAGHGGGKVDREASILEAVLRLLSRDGISGVSMRAVAREAKVAVGLVHYYYVDKPSLIAAALLRVEEQDVAIVEPDRSLSPEQRVRTALRRVADPEFLTTEYLSLRLQLWALAQADPTFADINTRAQARYRTGLARLIADARPGLSRAECERRATDIDILQNGMWLTALLGLSRTSIRRTVERTEQVALADARF
jgi:TetR/AcrR family transcriptional regulator, cholesterol catabolism regulator